jgi:hypothetical protein
LACLRAPTLQTGVFGARGSDKAAPSSRTADVQHIAIALGCIGIDKSRYQQPTINGYDFAILFFASRSKAIAQWDYDIANSLVADMEKRAKGCSFVLKHFTFDHPNYIFHAAHRFAMGQREM